MNSEQITAFLQQHWNWVTLIIGVILLIGAIMNRNWLCDPTGKPDSHRYGRSSRRVIFFLLGTAGPPVPYFLLNNTIPQRLLQKPQTYATQA